MNIRMYMILLSKSKDYILDPKTGQTTDEDTEYHYKYTAVSSNSVHSTHTTLIKAPLKSDRATQINGWRGHVVLS